MSTCFRGDPCRAGLPVCIPCLYFCAARSEKSIIFFVQFRRFLRIFPRVKAFVSAMRLMHNLYTQVLYRHDLLFSRMKIFLACHFQEGFVLLHLPFVHTAVSANIRYRFYRLFCRASFVPFGIRQTQLQEKQC